jgi:hypothetical protein
MEKICVQDQVIQDLHDRKNVGLNSYGTLLYPFNGRNALVDLYEELLDACCYVKQFLIEYDELQVRLTAAEERGDDRFALTAELVEANRDLGAEVVDLRARLSALTDAIGDPDELRRCALPLAITVTPMESMYVRLCRIANAAAAVQSPDPTEFGNNLND